MYLTYHIYFFNIYIFIHFLQLCSLVPGLQESGASLGTLCQHSKGC